MANSKNEVANKTNEVAGLNEIESSSLNVQFNVNIELLKNSFVAMYEKEGDKSKILIAPETINEPKTCSFKELFEDLESSFGIKKAEIEEKIKAVVGVEKAAKLQEVTVTLNTLFLYVDTADEKAPKEYAFAIEINLGEFADFGFAKLKNINLAIWNTERIGVIERMKLTTIAQQLKTFS